jgi:hypothetical protein
MAGESYRSVLLAGVQTFVTRACGLPGVRRIALIGSLATAKPNPKDADVLVWVEDVADLAPLAAAGRQLKGSAQSRNGGADIFLVNPAGTYQGRTCGYRDCRPGIRMSCRAQQCGRRPHLCDDLQVVTLPADVIAAPPADLWPTIVVRAPIPDDVREMIVAMNVASDACRETGGMT